MSRNSISANPEHYIFKLFRGSVPPDPPGRHNNFFQDRLSPQTKIPRWNHAFSNLALNDCSEMGSLVRTGGQLNEIWNQVKFLFIF